jgi:branched-chain amino acid transport system substrate-binding protein
MRDLFKLRAVAFLSVLVLAAVACGGGVGPGGSEGAAGGTEGGGAGGEGIVVGALFDLSGATADVGTPYADGIRDYVSWRNDNGGVEGRQIDLRWNDYAYDVAQAEQLYSQYISQGAVAIQGWGTGDTEALRSRVSSDEVPFMSASYAETLVDPRETPYNFVVGLTYSDEMRLALKWIAEDAGGEAEVAVFHHDSPFGESPVEDGRKYIEEQGLGLGYQAYAMPSGATDYVGQLQQAKQQGAEYIVIQNVASPGAQLARDVAAQGLDITVVCLIWCSDELYIELAGDSAEGTVMVQPFTPPSVEASGHDQPRQFLEDKGGNLKEASLHYVQGWYTMHVMVEGMARTVKAGGEVDGPAIKQALEEMEPIDTGDVTTPIEFTGESHKGMEGSRLYKVQNGSMVKLTDVLTP